MNDWAEAKAKTLWIEIFAPQKSYSAEKDFVSCIARALREAKTKFKKEGREEAAKIVENFKDRFNVELDDEVLVRDKDGPLCLNSDVVRAIREGK